MGARGLARSQPLRNPLFVFVLAIVCIGQTCLALMPGWQSDERQTQRN